jgi:hypothetical protein
MSNKSENALNHEVLAIFSSNFPSITSQSLQAIQEVFMSVKIQMMNWPITPSMKVKNSLIFLSIKCS